MCAYAQSFCSRVQPVGTFYTDTITQPGTYYYSAWTYDLPMQVHFVPSDPSVTTPPQIWVDLTCEPGIYSDPNIQELVRDTVKYGISVPMKLNGTSTWVDDHWEFDLRIGKSYRNKLKLVGVDYNVQAYVKVVYTSTGSLVMEQDTSANVCFNEAKRIDIGSRYRILEHDSVTTYLLPYQEWLDQGVDSVAIYWEGTDTASVWTSPNNCEFGLNTKESWDNWLVTANGGEYHLMRQKIVDALKQKQDTTGLFFTKIYSNSEGYLTVRQLMPDLQGSTLLEYDKKNDIVPGELYSFSNAWKGHTQWQAYTCRAVKMYIYNSPEGAAIDSFRLMMQGDTMRVQHLTTNELRTLNNKAQGPLLFARFECSGNFRLKPTAWTPAHTNVATSLQLHPNVPVRLAPTGSNATSALYRINAEEMSNPAYFVRNSTGSVVAVLAIYYDFSISSTNSNVIAYQSLSSNSPILVQYKNNGGDIEWTDDADEYGYIYAKFRYKDGGWVTVQCTLPDYLDPEDGELDPVYYDDQQTPPGPTTGFGSEAQAPVIRKVVLPTGQLVILRDGAAYDLQGRRLH